MTEAEAIQHVTLHAQTEAFPALESDTVQKIVRNNKRAAVWAAETAYNVGDRVQPTARNGHFYECIQAGTSDSEEPVWFTTTGRESQEFASDLIWKECALDLDGNLYNLRNAVHEAWMLKASLAAKEFDVSLDQQSWKRSQVYEHCREMAEKFQPYD